MKNFRVSVVRGSRGCSIKLAKGLNNLSVVGNPLAIILGETNNCGDIVWFRENIGYGRLNTLDGNLKSKVSDAFLEQKAFDE